MWTPSINIKKRQKKEMHRLEKNTVKKKLVQ